MVFFVYRVLKGSDFIFIFNWGMVALQYCVSAVQRSESAIGIHISPPSWTSFPTPPPSHPSAATAAAKSLQSCPTLCDPIDGSPPDSPVPGTLQVRTLE